MEKNPYQTMPEPPQHLIEEDLRTWTEISTNQDDSRLELPAIEVPVNHANNFLVERAHEDRTVAEANYAEIYLLYLETLRLNEQLIRRITTYKKCQRKMRPLFDAAKRGDAKLRGRIQQYARDMEAIQSINHTMQIENEALSVSLETHRMAFEELSKEVGRAQIAVDKAEASFQEISIKYEARGAYLDDAENAVRSFQTQVQSMERDLKEFQKENSNIKEQNLFLETNLRESRVQEQATTGLNRELAGSLSKLQKWIAELEERALIQKTTSNAQIATLEAGNARLLEKIEAQALVQKVQDHRNTNEIREAAQVPSHDLYKRWNRLLGEIHTQASIHASSIDKPYRDMNSGSETMISERGDLELL